MFLNFKARTVHIYKTCIMKQASRKQSLLLELHLYLHVSYPCSPSHVQLYLFSLSDLFIFKAFSTQFVHHGKIHTVAVTWASFFSVWGQSRHCCNLLCFNPQEASVHPPTRACQALLGLMAWRRTFWLKTTAVLFSHPVRQSNIIFEELHNK